MRSAQDLIRAIRLNPGQIQLYIELGQVCYQEGDRQTAAEAYATAITLGASIDELPLCSTDEVLYLCLIGALNIYGQRTGFDDSVVNSIWALYAHLKSELNYVDSPWWTVAEALVAGGRCAAAIELITANTKGTLGPTMELLLADAYYGAGQLDEALKIWARQLVTKCTDVVRIHDRLAKVFRNDHKNPTLADIHELCRDLLASKVTVKITPLVHEPLSEEEKQLAIKSTWKPKQGGDDITGNQR